MGPTWSTKRISGFRAAGKLQFPRCTALHGWLRCLHAVAKKSLFQLRFAGPCPAFASLRYDGGVLEVSTDKSLSGSDAILLFPKDGSFRRTVEDRLGPLTQCHLRRGEGWMTLFRGAITKQLKREEAGRDWFKQGHGPER